MLLFFYILEIEPVYLLNCTLYFLNTVCSVFQFRMMRRYCPVVFKLLINVLYVNEDNNNLLDKFNLIDTLTKYLVILFYIVCVWVIHMFTDVHRQRGNFFAFNYHCAYFDKV